MRKTFSTITSSPDETRKLGEQLGGRLKGSETLALQGNLGGGKTTFIQGLAEGMGIARTVTSPTFVLEKIYAKPRSNNPSLYHYDLYRLNKADIFGLDLSELFGEAVIAVEWAERARDIMPADTIWVSITLPTETTRKFTFEYEDEQKYLFE